MSKEESLLEISRYLVPQRIPVRIDAILIGVSTGGPDALVKLVSNLSVKIPCPIFIVLHIREGFSKSFVQLISRKTEIPVYEAQNEQVAKDGSIYIAPAGKHMIIKYNKNQADAGMYRIYLNETDEVNSCRPSVDVLFNSAAEIANNNMVGLIMTGIGYDGADGAYNLYSKGKGLILIQDKSSSVVWGMPKNTLLKECVSEIHHLDALAGRINNLTARGGSTSE